jgi:hypothetical protein
MAQFFGYGILFGVGSSAATLSGLGTLSLGQSQEYNSESDEDLVLDSSGNVAAVAKFNHRAKATLEFVPTTGTNTANTGTLTVSSWPSAGSTLAITDALFQPLGVTWIVDSLQLTRSNTSKLMARISLSRYLVNSIPG